MISETVRTTVALPSDLLERVDRAVHAGKARSRNAFLAEAVRHELAAQERFATDAAFAAMVDDVDYLAEADDIMAGFATADAETLRLTESSS